jgi:hypothetical protein
MIRIMEDLSGDWRRLDERIQHVTEEIEVLAHGSESCRQLMSVPGIGPIIPSAMVAAIGNRAAFAKGRDFAAWLGLVPKQMSTGDRTILGRISKRGNRYLRTLLMQGARVILLRPAKWAKHNFGPVANGRGWQPHSPISWRGSPGLYWRRHAATMRASSREWRTINVFGTRRGVVQGRSLTQRGMYRFTCRGLRVELRRWRNGLAAASVIWWH